MHDNRNEVLESLRTRINNLAVELGVGDRKFSNPMYLKNSREFNKSRKLRANNGHSRKQFVGQEQPYQQMTGNYNTYAHWADYRYRGDPRYTST